MEPTREDFLLDFLIWLFDSDKHEQDHRALVVEYLERHVF